MEAKISLCADDMVCFLRKPLKSLQYLAELLKVFGTVAGYKINELNQCLWDLSSLPNYNKDFYILSQQNVLRTVLNI